jgi:hypothetical protein
VAYNFQTEKNKIKLLKEYESEVIKLYFVRLYSHPPPTSGSYNPEISLHAFSWALGWAEWTNSVTSALALYYAASFLPVAIR